jgi:predicted deacylase
MVLGGTHGNEPAGYEAAYRLLRLLSDRGLQKGKLIVIPEANAEAVRRFSRRVAVPKGVDLEMGNLNRCYPGTPDGLPMQRLAWQIMELARQEKVSLFLDLHESPVFHLESLEDEGMRLGQSIVYFPNEESAWLAMVAADAVNAGIPERLHTFSLLEKPIERSAAWAIGTELGIAAFTIETCKKLPLETRVAHQLQIVLRMLQEKGMLFSE